MVDILTLEAQVQETKSRLEHVVDELARVGRNGQRERLETAKLALARQFVDKNRALEAARARQAHEATDEYKQEHARALREVEKLSAEAVGELDALLSSVLSASEHGKKYQSLVERVDKLKSEYSGNGAHYRESAGGRYARAVAELVQKFAGWLSMERHFSPSALSEKYAERFNAAQ